MTADNQNVISTPNNGPGAAAVLASGIGAFALGAVACAADKVPVLGRRLIFYRPTGPLSGVSTVAIFIWLATWATLHSVWKCRDVNLSLVVAISLVLLSLGILLTFPPIAALF